MPKKKVATIDIVKAMAGVSFTTLAAIGSSTGNPVLAGLSALPAAGLASYEALGSHLLLHSSRKEKMLELPAPPWWQYDIRSWQNLCAEIGNLLPAIVADMQTRIQREQRVLTNELVHQIFIESLTDQPLTWETNSEQKRRIGEFLALPFLQKLDEVLTPLVKQIQDESALVDARRTAQSTEQVVHLLEKIHEDISDTNMAPVLSEEELASIRRQYCSLLYERWKMLDFRGIMHVDMNRSISIPLIEVFVFPEVFFGIPEYETLEREGEHVLYGYSALKKPRRIIPQREALPTALMKHRCLVLLGDPGSGKSTLLRYLLLRLVQGKETFVASFPQLSDIAGTVPLYIPLSAYAENMLATLPGNRSFEDFLPIYLRDNYLGEYADFLLGLLQRGNLLLLLDGLDEIPDATLRVNVVRHIELFTQSHSANRFIVTSRIVGYKETPLACDYQVYTLADFSEDQVKTFTRQWCPAYERWVKSSTESQYLVGAATREAEKLFNATQSKPAVKRLAVNPLLLTILALIQRQGIELPSHRIELFDLCAMTLIDTWVKAKGYATNFSKNELVKILRPLAFWMHEHPAVGSIPEEELYDQIVQHLVKRTISEQEAIKQAEQFLQTVRGKTGILIERGKGRYGFLHLTFEEYFAAMELAKRKDRNAFIKKHLHEPRWREVILLAVSAIGILQSNEEEVTELVHDVICHAHSPYEWVLHRDLLFAGLCLADDVGVTLACEYEIVEQIIYLYLTSPYNNLRRACSEVLAEWRGTRVGEKATALVAPLLRRYTKSTGEEKTFLAASPFEKRLEAQTRDLVADYRQVMAKWLRFDLTIALARLQALDDIPWQENILDVLSEEAMREKIRSVLQQQKDGESSSLSDILLMALSDPDEDVKVQVLRALAYLGNSEPHVIDALLTALSDRVVIVKAEAANTLARLGEAQPRIINALLADPTEFKLYKRAAVNALWCLAERQPECMAILLKALVDMEDQDVRDAASNVLELLNNVDEDITDLLLAVLSNPTAEIITAFASLLSKVSNDPEELFVLLRRSLSDPDLAKEVAIRALGYAGRPHPPVVEALFAILAGPDSNLRILALRSLGRLGKDQQRVIDALLDVRSDPSWRIRREAIKALEQLNNNQPVIFDALLPALSDVDKDVREAAVFALTKLAREDPHVTEALIATLSDAYRDVREAAVTALGRRDEVRPLVIERLRAALSAIPHDDSLLPDTVNYERRLRRSIVGRIMSLLKDLECTQPDVVEAMLSVLSLTNVNTFIKYEIAQVFGQLGKKEPQIIDKLLAIFPTAKRRVRTIIMNAIGFCGSNSPHVHQALLSALADTDSEVRSAAAQALGQIGGADTRTIDALLQALTDSSYQVRQQAASSLGRFHTKQPRVVDALLLTLTDTSGLVRAQAARALGDLGDDQPRVTDALIQRLSDSSRWAMEGASYALGRLVKDQLRVIEILLAALHSSDASTRARAVQTLGWLGDGQAAVIEALVSTLSDPNYLVREDAAEALSRVVKGQSHAVQALLSSLSDSSSSVRAAAAHALGNIKAEEAPIVTALLQTLSDSSWPVRVAAASSLAVHSQRSEVIEAQLENLLRQSESTTLRELGGYNGIFSALQNLAEKL